MRLTINQKNETMKKWITPIILIGCLSVNAQGDTTQYRFGDKKILIVKSVDDVDSGWDDFDICDTLADDEDNVEGIGYLQVGVNGYMTPSNSLTLPIDMSLMELDYAKSRSASFNIQYYINKMKRSTVYISPGLGLDYKSYFFKNNVNIGTGNDTVLFALDTARTYKKYKLRATYFQVPLIVGLRLGGKSKKRVDVNDGEVNVQVRRSEKSFNIQAGVIGGYNIGSLIKTKYDQDGAKYKDKIKDDFNLNPFKLTATARIGYGNFGFFANYGLTSLFQNGKSPDLIPFTVGVQLGGF